MKREILSAEYNRAKNRGDFRKLLSTHTNAIRFIGSCILWIFL